MCLLALLANLGVQGMGGSRPLADCPCCADAAEVHINADFNFSLTHLAKCGTSNVRLPAPNALLFLDSAKAAQLVEAANGDRAAAAPVEADRACSDFDAARILGRTSEKVPCLFMPMLACMCNVVPPNVYGLACCSARRPLGCPPPPNTLACRCHAGNNMQLCLLPSWFPPIT